MSGKGPEEQADVLAMTEDTDHPEQYYRDLVENANDVMFTLDLHGRFLTINHMAEELIGYTRGQAQHMTIADVVVPEDLARVRQEMQRKLEGQLASVYQVRVRTRDGEVVPLELSTCLIVRHGRPVAIQGVGRDMRERLRAEAALRESEERFTSAFHHAAIGMSLVGLDGRFLQVNPALCALTGYDEEELLARTFQDITHPDDLDVDLAYVQRVLAGEIQTYRMEKRYLRRDGSLVWVLLTVSLLRDAAGQPQYFVSQVQDISDRKAMEQDLIGQHALLQTVFETTPVGIVVTDAEGRQVNSNGRRSELLGYTEEELEQLTFEHFTHPDDLAQELPLFRELVEGERDEYALDKRYMRKDGTIVWVHLKTAAVRAEDGTLRFIVAVTQDITERKEAEASLRQLAQHDAVTGLPNRRLFDDRIQQALALAARRGEVLGLLFIDLDGFKAVNDTHGHDLGDRLLRTVGETLVGSVRGSDTVARWAGDEFAVLLPDVGSARNAERTASKLLDRICGITEIDGRPLTISAAFGVSLYPFNGTNAAALLEAADGAMYAAKQRGTGQIGVATAERR